MWFMSMIPRLKKKINQYPSLDDVISNEKDP